MTGVRGNGPPWGVKGQGGVFGIPGVYAALDRSGPLVEMMKIDGAWGVWKNDEAAGSTIVDYSGNARDMTITGAPTAYRTAVGGKTGYGMTWPATATDKAATSQTPSNAGIFTMESLLYFTANPSVAFGMLSADDGSAGSLLQLLNTGQVRFQCTNSGGSFIQTAAALALNTLHHCVAVNTGGTMRLRVNGVSPANQTKVAANASKAVRFHTNFAGSGGGPATIGVSAYYDGIALTDAQIDAHFASI